MILNVPDGKIAFIINARDRLTDLKKLLYWAKEINTYPIKIYIIDNNSTYIPLLEYYDNEIEVDDDIVLIRMDTNYGCKVISRLDIRSSCDYYIYTDCDIIPKENCPPNVIEHLISLSKKYPLVNKIGLSIAIDDIPDVFSLKDHIQNIESKNWNKQPKDRDVYIADVYTTFALYRNKLSSVHIISNNMRTNSPYTARHLTWYMDTNKISSEFAYYANNANNDCVIGNFMKSCQLLETKNVERKLIKRNTSRIPPSQSNSPIIGHLQGKTFRQINSKGQVTNLTFVNNKIAKAYDTSIGDVICQGRRVRIQWRDRKDLLVIDLKNNLKSYTGTSQIDGRVEGQLISNDLKTTPGPEYNPNIISGRPTILQQQNNNITKKNSNLFIVVAAYKIEDQRITNFLSWNKSTFERCAVTVYIVTDRKINLNSFPFARCVIYSNDQDVFSIGKTINYGIRSINCADEDIIIKTDIDIIFTCHALNNVRKNVSIGAGNISLCSHVNSSDNINSLDWRSRRIDSEGRGACFALTKYDWYSLKGYDERIRGWGGDDNEMWLRARSRIRMNTMKNYPIYHIKHPIRITKGEESFFEHRSDKNMKLSQKLDWSNENWGMPKQDPNDLYFVFAITTVNRVNYLKSCISSWNNTRRKDVKWKLIVADDGSTDGTLEYLATLKIPDVAIKIINNNKRGVHHQANTIFRELDGSGFTVCFKVDDDVFFTDMGWDMLYYSDIKRTGYDHLCLYQTEWRRGTQSKQYNGLISRIDIENVQGCFYTITQNIINKVGYMDTQNFGLTGLGHQDFTARCCRAGFNRIDMPLDTINGQLYIKLKQGNYKSAIPMTWRNKENTDEVLKRKRLLIRDQTRLYIPYSEISRRVGE